MLQIELTSEEALLSGAACAIVSAVISHPEIAYDLESERAKVFVQAAMEIASRTDAWNAYMDKMLEAIRKVNAPTNL